MLFHCLRIYLTVNAKDLFLKISKVTLFFKLLTFDKNKISDFFKGRTKQNKAYVKIWSKFAYA